MTSLRSSSSHPASTTPAYFEHSYLAQKMGVKLVEGADLAVGDDDCVYMKAIEGLVRVDVIYSRVNATYLDPEVFEKTSILGVRGLMRAWRAGNVAIANAPGDGRCRRQSRLYVRAGDDPVLSGGGAPTAERADVSMLGAE